jgi:hypothetical protein
MNKCENCEHKTVCKYTTDYKDHQDRIKKEFAVELTCTSIFRIELHCSYYKQETNLNRSLYSSNNDLNNVLKNRV